MAFITPKLLTVSVLLLRSVMPTQVGNEKRLLGRWIAYDEGNQVKSLDGHVIVNDSIKVMLSFTADNKVSISSQRVGYGNTTSVFNYRLINQHVVAFYSTNSKLTRHSFEISKDKLTFRPYPPSRDLQESIDLLYTLSFIKQP